MLDTVDQKIIVNENKNAKLNKIIELRIADMIFF